MDVKKLGPRDRRSYEHAQTWLNDTNTIKKMEAKKIIKEIEGRVARGTSH